jgi:uncharacterized protein (DUF983 family)
MSGEICRCKYCGRQFAFTQFFTPARDVCFSCGPLDGRRQAEAKAAELRDREKS